MRNASGMFRGLRWLTLAGIAAMGATWLPAVRDAVRAQGAASPEPAMRVDCSRNTANCPRLDIAGDPASRTPTFSGFADPGIVADLVHPRRIWMAYSHLEGRRATGASGSAVGIPVASTHIARSDDGGATWRFETALWDSPLTPDPERRGPASFFGSETPSLAAVRNGESTRWYSVRLSYFLEPVTAYQPRYATSWMMRVAAADGATPAALAGVEEAKLGTRTTASAYGAHVNLNALAPQLAGCGMWNNPVVAALVGRLYVVAECLEFDGKEVNHERTRMIVLSTAAAGRPPDWRWDYVGVLADHALARELGGERLVSATIARGRDGALLFIATPQAGRELTGQGCVVLELDSLDPPRIRRDATGRPQLRAVQTASADRSWHTGACTYDPTSSTGLLTVAATTSRGLQAEIRATRLRP
jgi:hypothetical protein